MVNLLKGRVSLQILFDPIIIFLNNIWTSQKHKEKLQSSYQELVVAPSSFSFYIWTS